MLSFSPASWRRFNSLGLPALLLAVSFGVGGAYYETSDDPLLTLLLRGDGTLAAAPVTELRPFLPGLSWGLATLYRLAPILPWYALTLTAGLYGALAMIFGLLDQLAPLAWSGRRRALLLTGFFGVALLDHVLCYNFTRPAMLLGAAAGWHYAAAIWRQPTLPAWGALGRASAALTLGLALRFDAALVGLLLTIPGIWLLTGLEVASPLGRQPWWRLGRVLAPFGLIALVWTGLDVATRSPVRQLVFALNHYQGQIHDYGNYFVDGPVNRADSLRIELVSQWLIGPPTDVTPAFYERVGGTDWPRFLREKAGPKARLLFDRLLHIYEAWGLLAAGLLMLSWPATRHRYLLLLPGIWTGAAVLVIGVWLKFPDRVAAPIFSILLINQTIGWLRTWPTRVVPGSIPWLAIALLTVGAADQTLHLTRQQRAALARHKQQQALYAVLQAHYPAGSCLVLPRLTPLLRGTAVFSEAPPVSYVLLPLGGWYLIDPAYEAQWRNLTGARTWPQALQRLAVNSQTVWLLSPAQLALLQSYLQEAFGETLPAIRLGPPLP